MYLCEFDWATCIHVYLNVSCLIFLVSHLRKMHRNGQWSNLIFGSASSYACVYIYDLHTYIHTYIHMYVRTCMYVLEYSVECTYELVTV